MEVNVTKRQEAYQLVGALVEAAERLAKAQAEFDEAQADWRLYLGETRLLRTATTTFV